MVFQFQVVISKVVGIVGVLACIHYVCATCVPQRFVFFHHINFHSLHQSWHSIQAVMLGVDVFELTYPAEASQTRQDQQRGRVWRDRARE